MAYKVSIKQFNHVLNTLSDKYKIYGPKKIEKKGRYSDTDLVCYKPISGLDEMELNEKSFFSPKEIIYPIRETLFYFTEDNVSVPSVPDEKIIIFLRPCDINGMKRLDTIFLQNGPEQDFYYKRLREKVKFFMIECNEGFDSCFCVSMNGNKTDEYAVACKFNNDNVILNIQDEEFKALFSEGAEEVQHEVEFVEENKVKVEIPPVDKVTKEVFENDIWTEYTHRCIGCGRCNTSCITCACFTMQDQHYGKDNKMGERRRVWASCQVDGYSTMAGNHDFRTKKGDRMRFKTMHKINDFHKRFGFHMCVGCGRCDDVCPEYISFPKCIEKVNEIVKGDSNE
ncbi:anaerobic sulfite reductase subunit AsrA [Anaeromicrobium sediminis]|uniref:Anaerobic sulfite reductase subunit A n=1 Tax=Anaeromicrobium sediminis TaxID=1478221 RepID=A0A267MH23_9FIRM|nr:anaerobic sulfite reductase subunit AsrA [Anaeromicrobium sediminis]PAB58702.1 anaerobic sulfite reductase subunit A [Anaeromicrobium sediminis]